MTKSNANDGLTVRLVATEHGSLIEIRARVTVKKALAILSGVSGLLWVAINFLIR